MTAPYRHVAGSWKLRVYMQPGARGEAVGGCHDDCLKVRVAALPSAGRANVAVLSALSAALDVPVRVAHLAFCAGCRRKVVRIRVAPVLGASCRTLPGPAVGVP